MAMIGSMFKLVPCVRCHPVIRLLWLIVGLVIAQKSEALANPKVDVELSQATAEVGEAVQLTIQISDGRLSELPKISVDGLDIGYAGESSQFVSINGRTNQSRIYAYVITANREGEYTIPALTMDVDGTRVMSEPVRLKVTKAPNSVQGLPEDKVAFGQITTQVRNVYVGQTIEVEASLYLSGRLQWQLERFPKIEGDGFTAAGADRILKKELQIAGEPYVSAYTRLTLTPTKAGKLVLGPLPVELVMIRAGSRRAMTPLDRMFGPQGQAVKRTVPLAALELDVKPLPTLGRPQDFTGAIGEFELEATGTPAQVKAGDPVTMRVTVRGRGNFDRIGRPAMVDAAGWETYDATDSFANSDELGLEGAKAWEFAVIPREKKREMPRFTLSFFEPKSGQYKTLATSGSPLEVIGNVPVAPTTATGGGHSDVELPKTAVPTPGLEGILDERMVGTTFPTVPSFGILSALTLLPALVLALGKWLFGRSESEDLKRERTLRARLAGERAAVLENSGSERVEAVYRALQCAAALRLRRDPAICGDDAILEAGGHLSVELLGVLREFLEARERAAFGGGSDALRERSLAVWQELLIAYEGGLS
jgi:hypothetical protein